MLSSLGGRLIAVVRQAGKQADGILVVYKIFKNLTTSILKHV